MSQNASNEPKKDDFNSYVKDGVEVVDVKVIPKDKGVKVDKFGIPINENRKTWDKI